MSGMTPETLRAIDEDSVTDEELLVGERTALDTFFDIINARRMAQTLWFFVCIQAIYAIVMFGSGEATRGAVAGLVALGDLLVLRQRNAPAVTRNIRQTAAAACKLGMHCEVLLEHRVPQPSELYSNSGNVFLDRIFGELVAAVDERTAEQARTDGLTGLFNHGHFWSCLRRELGRAGESSGRLAHQIGRGLRPGDVLQAGK